MSCKKCQCMYLLFYPIGPIPWQERGSFNNINNYYYLSEKKSGLGRGFKP